MGQQQSKGSDGTRTPVKSSSSNNLPDSLQQYPSISKSDTKESTSRSIRSQIRSKVKSAGSEKGSTDSPRASGSLLSGLDGAGNDKSETSSIASGRGRNSAQSPTSPPDDDDEAPSPGTTTPARPPSPTQSKSVGKGHKSLDRAQRTGEVGAVSDEAPHQPHHHSATQKAGESILVKRENQINPRAPETKASLRARLAELPGASPGGGMGMSDVNDMDLDDMISRLLDAGYQTKVTKAVCLKNAEITAVCTAVRETLLSQPALLELSAPVKIVGDIHGQYSEYSQKPHARPSPCPSLLVLLIQACRC